jgi:hypothetical protein
VGADIYFPAGTFLVNNLTVSVAGLHIVGSGRRASIIRRNATGVLFQVNAADVTIEGLRFDGQGSTYGGGQMLLATSAATDLVVDSCTVEGASASSPHAVTASGNGFVIRNSRIYGDVQILNTDNCRIDGNRFYPPTVAAAAFGATVAALTPSTGTADNCRVVNNYFEIPTDRFAISPISRNGAIQPRGTIIANNVMIAVGNAYGGISIDTCNGGSITGNVFRIASGVPTIAPLEIVATDRVTATGNYFDCGAVLEGPAISVNAANDCTISGNVVLSGTLTNSENVISLIAPTGKSSSRNVVIGNKVITTSSTDAYGIGLSCQGTGVIASTIISGNHINNSGSDARGIRLAAGSSGGSITNTLIDGNIIENGTFGFYFNNDVGTALVNNRTVGTVTTRIGVSTGGATGGTNIQLSGNSWQTATAAPTTQYHFAGERVTNSAPAVGSPQGWVCTASGTPGTWVAMPNL